MIYLVPYQRYKSSNPFFQVVATPAVAPVAIAAYPYAHHYGAYGAYPAYAHAAYAGAYAGYPYAGAYGHPAYAFGGYPYALPVAAAKAE